MTSEVMGLKPPDLGVDGASRVAPLIKNDKVHGSLYTDPAIFAEELQKSGTALGFSSVTKAKSASRVTTCASGSACRTSS